MPIPRAITIEEAITGSADLLGTRSVRHCEGPLHAVLTMNVRRPSLNHLAED
jgi:hypothetical protein